jgi:tetratricopeptide (TPR) repeat protein
MNVESIEISGADCGAGFVAREIDAAPETGGSAEDNDLSLAWKAYRLKRDDECSAICKPHLTASARGAPFWALEGLLRQRRAAHRAAVEAFRAALAFGRSYPWINHALAVSALAAGDAPTAVVHLRVAVTDRPDVPAYQVRLGIALQEAGHYTEADGPLRKAAELEPDNSTVHLRLGFGAQEAQQLEQALAHFADVLRLDPTSVVAHVNRGAVLCELGQFGEGLAALQRAIDLAPSVAENWLRRASALFSRGLIPEAIRHAVRAVHLSPGSTNAHVLLGKLHASQGRMDAADECFNNALRMHPANAHTRISQAVMLERRGDVAGARIAVDAALGEIPDHPQLLILLGRMAKARDDRQSAAGRIEKRLAGDPPLSRDTQSQLQFVLASLYDQENEAERAFRHLRDANAYRRGTRPFDRARTAAEFRAIREVFTADFMNAAPRSRVDGRQMIFIVGMPRSGTSLTEQIIAAHPQAYGSGELTTLDRIARRWPDGDDVRHPVEYPAYFPKIDDAGLTEIAYRYLNRLPQGAREHARVTDKMPYNFLHVGMIALLFPGARIVHCMRSPVDTTFSCFLQDFLEGNAFSYSLEDCGWFYNQYRSLMDHWQQVMPPYPMMQLQYEELVAKPEHSVRNLLEFCGLDWDPSCLAFHQSRRLVHTASYQQVREPLYTRAVGRWRAYEPYLGPLLQELGHDSAAFRVVANPP